MKYWKVLLPMVAMILQGCANQSPGGDQGLVAGGAQDLPPQALKFNQASHPLGRDQQPDSRLNAYGFVLLNNLSLDEPKRAESTCKALFSQPESDRPLVTPSQRNLVSYLNMARSGDYTRLSGRANWSLCNYLSEVHDRARDAHWLAWVGYPKTRGPLLLIVPQSFNGKRPEQAYIADLSYVADKDIAAVISNWKYRVSVDPRNWQRPVELAGIRTQLTFGVGTVKVAIVALPHGAELQGSQETADQTDKSDDWVSQR